MTILLFLILASLSLALAALAGFVWAVRSGQFEDTCTPSMRILTDDGARVSSRAATLTGQAVHEPSSLTTVAVGEGTHAPATQVF